ncbi:jg23895 [Pararge aegeria aegeria]|uniref:Jg23895 protein n=1 Tax=Pararge aegeria aegeria TaxID=348720 RepID=A0A8S4S2S9_9NEOP|nr:jg23895 [Pararge aegeria aegeria]
MSQSSSSSRGARKAVDPVKKSVTMRKKVLTKNMDDVSQSDTSDSDTHQTKNSQSTRSSMGEPAQQSMATLPATANRLFQEAKEQIELSGNTDIATKHKVLENLAAMYEIVLRLSESRQTLQIQLEKARAHSIDQVLAKEREYASRLVELAESVKSLDVRPSVSEILTEVKSLRQLIVFDVLDQLSHNLQQQPPQTVEITKQLQESSNKLAEIVEESKTRASYAEMAARLEKKKKPTNQQPNHSIIVSSKIEKDTSEDVLHKIREAANAHDNLKIDDAKNKDPLVIIKNVLTYNSDDDIQVSIKTQNKEALKDIQDEDYRAIVKYRRKARNPHECHVIMQVSPKVWRALTVAERVHIDLQRCQVFDQSPLVQCTRCLGF